jgi:hypothetical protein
MVYSGMSSCIWSGLARTLHIGCIYGIFGRDITRYTVIYSVYIIYGSGQPEHMVLSGNAHLGEGKDGTPGRLLCKLDWRAVHSYR